MTKLATWRLKAYKEFPRDADEDGCDTIKEFVERAEATLEIVEGGCSMYDDDMSPREIKKFITELKNYIKRFTPHAVAEEEVAEVAEVAETQETDEPTIEQKLIAKELELSIRERDLEERVRALEAREAELKVKEQQLEQKLQDAEKAHQFYKEKRAELKAKEQELDSRVQEVSEISSHLDQQQEEINTASQKLICTPRQATAVTADKVRQAVELYNANVDTPVEELAKQLGVTRRTFYRYLKKAEGALAVRQPSN